MSIRVAFLPPLSEFDLFEEKLELVVWAGDREVNVVGGVAADEERALVVPLR